MLNKLFVTYFLKHPPNLFGNKLIVSFNWAISKLFQSSKSEKCFIGSKLSLTVPENKMTSCGITESLDLNSSKWIVEISTLSIRILPSVIPTTPNKDIASVDLPLPAWEFASLLQFIKAPL